MFGQVRLTLVLMIFRKGKIYFNLCSTKQPACEAQSVMCLTADTCLTVDLDVASLTLTRCYIFVEIDHEIISTAILLPLADSQRVVVSYK